MRAVGSSSLCILMFFCSYVFYLLLLSALVDIVPSLRLDPWSRPGMTVSEALVQMRGWVGISFYLNCFVLLCY